jgi:TPR repeat protein
MKTTTKIGALIAICFLLILAGLTLIPKLDIEDGSYKFKLGKLFEFAVFVPVHNRIAEHYYIEAAKKKNSEAQCNLGMFYESQEDYQKSLYWYLQSSLNGWWRCEDDFERYNFPDEQRAFAMLKIKADSENRFAQYMVGKRYIEANGIEKDVQIGIKYLKKAATDGNRGAQLYLAGLYLKGVVVSADPQEAEKWMDMNWENK